MTVLEKGQNGVSGENIGKFICTVAGDIQVLGKDYVCSMLKASGNFLL